MRLALAALLLSVACGDHDHGGYPTYQVCFDEHIGAEALPFYQAVIICCADHPIDGVGEVCGQTAAACVTYLGSNLTSTATQQEVQAACDEYIVQLGM
jgi:hypothetical protein